MKGASLLTPDAQELFARAVLCWLATADTEGHPSVSPKEIFTVESETSILIADIASPHSVRNIHHQAQVCVAAVDVFEQLGYQAYGTAEVINRDDDRFSTIAAPLLSMATPRFPVRAAIRITVHEVKKIQAPSLWMYPDADAAVRRQGALRAYGVQDAATEQHPHEG